jgi:hypothetical protein
LKRFASIDGDCQVGGEMVSLPNLPRVSQKPFLDHHINSCVAGVLWTSSDYRRLPTVVLGS